MTVDDVEDGLGLRAGQLADVAGDDPALGVREDREREADDSTPKASAASMASCSPIRIG